MRQYEFVPSSYSSGGGECVEVARNLPGLVALRDSKVPGGALVRVSAPAWGPFLGLVRGDGSAGA